MPVKCRSVVRWRLAKDLSLFYSDVIMGAMTAQITSLTIVYLIVYSGAAQRKHQSSASLVNSPHKRPVALKMFHWWCCGYSPASLWFYSCGILHSDKIRIGMVVYNTSLFSLFLSSFNRSFVLHFPSICNNINLFFCLFIHPYCSVCVVAYI